MKKLGHHQLEELVLRAQQGDDSAFAVIYAGTVEGQLYFATMFLKDWAMAEDAVQETYLALYRSLAKLDNPRTLVAYLNRICYNTCVDFKRRMNRRFQEQDRDQELQSASDKATDHNPEESLEVSELCKTLHYSLAGLDDNVRAAFLLRHYHEMKIKDIAGSMSLSESTVKRYIRQATDALRQKMEQPDPF